MKFKAISFKEEDVDFAFIDFYTDGHFIFGYIAYLVVYLFTIIFLGKNHAGFSMTITINIGLIWEFIENFYLHKRGYKYDNRRDSFANSLTDVLFVNIGGIVAGIISMFEVELFFIYTILILMISLILYDILRRITFSEKNNYGRKVE